MINDIRDINIIEREIFQVQTHIATLLFEGALVLGRSKTSGANILQWLTDRGMSDNDARHLCVKVIYQLREERENGVKND